MADEDITLDGKPLQSLRVADLKAALEQRNLPKSGHKNALLKRLKGALMLENLQKSSSSHSGLQPNSQIGEEMSQNSFIKQYLAKQQELLRQRLEREAQQEEDTDESPAAPDEDEDHSEDNDSSSYVSDKHCSIPPKPSMTRAEERGDSVMAHGMMAYGSDMDPGPTLHPQESLEAPGARMLRATFHQGHKEPPAPSPPRAVASLSVRVLGQPDRQGLPPAVPRAQEKEGTAPSEPGLAHPVLHLSRSAGVLAGGQVHEDSDDDDDGDDESEDDDDWGPGPGGARRGNRAPPQPQQMPLSVPSTTARSKRKLQPPQHIPPPQVHHTPMQLRHPTPPPSPPPDLFPLPDTPKQSPPDTNEQEGERPEASRGPRVPPFPPTSVQRQDSDSSSRSSSPEPPIKRRPGPLSLLVHKMESEGAFRAAEATSAVDISGETAHSAGSSSSSESPLQRLERKRLQENREMEEERRLMEEKEREQHQKQERERKKIQEQEREKKRLEEEKERERKRLEEEEKQHQRELRERERKRQEEEQEKERKRQEEEQEKERKQQEEEREKERKHQEEEREKERKHREEEKEKERKRQEEEKEKKHREEEKERKRLEDEKEKERKRQEEEKRREEKLLKEKEKRPETSNKGRVVVTEAQDSGSSSDSDSKSDSSSRSSQSSQSSSSSSADKIVPARQLKKADQEAEDEKKTNPKVAEKRYLSKREVSEPSAAAVTEVEPDSESSVAQQPPSGAEPENSEGRLEESTTPKAFAARKISLTSSKTSPAATDGGAGEADAGSAAGRKRRWGSSTAVTAKKPSISITTDSLKSLIPDIKVNQDAVVELHPEELHMSGDEESLDASRDDQDKGLKIRRTVTQVVPGDSQENGQANEEEEVEKTEKEKQRRTSRDKRKNSVSEESSETQTHVKLDGEAKKVTPSDSLVRRSISQQKSGVSVTIDDPVRTNRQPSPPHGKVSNIIHVTNLVRPFTLGQLKELLNRTGGVVEEGFWIDKIKSHCYVTYATTEEAVATRAALHGVKWPQSNPKVLSVDFCEQNELDIHKGILKLEMEEDHVAPPGGPQNRLPPLMPERDRDRDRDRDRERERDRDRGVGGVRDLWAERQREMERRERARGEREWDRDKVREFARPGEDGHRSRSRDRERRRRERAKSKERKTDKKEKGDEPPAKLLDDLFLKTKAAPCIYWLPLSEEQAAQRLLDRTERQKERERRRKEQQEEEEKKREEERKERLKGREKDVSVTASAGAAGRGGREADRDRERDRGRDRDGDKKRDASHRPARPSVGAGSGRRSRSRSNPRDRRR